MAELLADENRAVCVRVVEADAARLIRVRKLDAEAEAERRRDARFVAQLHLHPQRYVANVVGIGGVRAELQIERRRAASFDR